MITMLQALNILISIMTLITLASGLYFAIRRFGLRREKFTFLRMNLDAKAIKQLGHLSLVSVIVHLENVGQTLLSARTSEDKKNGKGDFLYEDNFDRCKHAGTLKIRPVQDSMSPELFDWYSLKPMSDIRISKNRKTSEGDLEQINTTTLS